MNNIEFVAQTKIKITFETPLATSNLPPPTNYLPRIIMIQKKDQIVYYKLSYNIY